MTSRRAFALPVAAALVLALGGCGGSGPARKAPALALACQTKDCVCVAAAASPFAVRRETAPLWRADGDAYCPEGFALEPVGN